MKLYVFNLGHVPIIEAWDLLLELDSKGFSPTTEHEEYSGPTFGDKSSVENARPWVFQSNVGGAKAKIEDHLWKVQGISWCWLDLG